MAEEQTRKLRVGDISTYEDAPDEFLRRRKEDLRARLRNPGLSTSEFLREVAGQAAVTTLAAAYSVWVAVDRIITIGMNSEGIESARKGLEIKNPKWWDFSSPGWWHRTFAIYGRDENGVRVRKSTFVSQKEVGTFESLYRKVAREIAYTFSKENHESFGKICKSLLSLANHFGFQGGKAALIKLKEDLGKITDLSQIPKQDARILDDIRSYYRNLHGEEIGAERLLDAYKCRKLFLFLKALHKDIPTSGIGSGYSVWREMGNIVEETPGGMANIKVEELGTDAFTNARANAVRTVIDIDNDAIIARVRNPAMLIVASTAALVTGYQAYKFANRSKSLDTESEMSHIERVERERRWAKRQAGQPQAQDPGHPPQEAQR